MRAISDAPHVQVLWQIGTERHRWVCIHSDYALGWGACDAFKRAYSEVGEEIGRVPVPLKTVNKLPYILQLAKLKPHFALAVFGGAENDPFFPEYYRFKLHEKIPVLAGSLGSTLPQRLRRYEKTLETHGTGVGLLAVNVYHAGVDNPANQQFVAAYQQTYKQSPSTNAMYGYDAGRLLVKALVELEGKWDGTKVVKLMKTLPYISPRHGQQLQFDTHGDVMNVAYIIKLKRQGKRLGLDIIGQVPSAWVNVPHVTSCCYFIASKGAPWIDSAGALLSLMHVQIHLQCFVTHSPCGLELSM